MRSVALLCLAAWAAALSAGAPAHAGTNAQLFVGPGIVVMLDRKVGVGLSVEASAMLAAYDGGPIAGPALRVRWVTSHGWQLAAMGRIGFALFDASNCSVGFTPYLELDAEGGYTVGREGGGLLVGAFGSIGWGALDVGINRTNGAWKDASLQLSGRAWLLPGCVADFQNF
jgi:hypothetical protein